MWTGLSSPALISAQRVVRPTAARAPLPLESTAAGRRSARRGAVADHPCHQPPVNRLTGSHPAVEAVPARSLRVVCRLTVDEQPPVCLLFGCRDSADRRYRPTGIAGGGSWAIGAVPEPYRRPTGGAGCSARPGIRSGARAVGGPAARASASDQGRGGRCRRPVHRSAGRRARPAAGASPVGSVRGGADLHSPFHHLDRGPVRGRGSGLLPGAMPACGRTPRGDRSSGPRRDRPAAPTARRRRGPPRATVHLGTGRLRASPLGRRPMGLLTSSSPAFTLSSPVAGTPVRHASEGAPQSPETRHHEMRSPECMRCVGS